MRPEPVMADPVEAEPVEAEPVEAQSDVDPTPEGIQVVAGECNLAGLPDTLRAPVTEEEAEAIRLAVSRWIAEEQGLGFELNAGILFSKSEDDSGAEPPLSLAERAQSIRACGQSAMWLQSRLVAQFQLHGNEEFGQPIRCSGRVCCYSALMEYDSAGGIVLGPMHGRWGLVAAYEVADNGTLGAEFIAEQYHDVLTGFPRARPRTCRDPGGPR